MKEELVFAYIDGANLDKGTTGLGWRIDYHKFYIWLKNKYSIDKAYIFIGYVEKYKNLYDKMRSAGFLLVFKTITEIGYGNIKGNCDAEFVLKVTRDVYETLVKKILIVSSDGDFSCLINFIKEKNKEVLILSPSKKCSIFLMRTGSKITYINDVRNSISIKITSKNEKAPDKN